MPIHARPPSQLAVGSDPAELQWLDQAIAMLRVALLDESPPELFGDTPEADEVFNRVVEVQIELCRSIRVLAQDGLVRSCFALLRSMLEIAASVGWLAIDFEGRVGKFKLSQMPGVQNIFGKIGWPNHTYKKLYGTLSDYAHGSFTTSHIHFEERNLSGSWDEGLLRIAIRENENAPLTGHYERTADDLLSDYGNMIAIHAFDFSLSTLIRACGPYSDSHSWWPRKNIDSFNSISNDIRQTVHTLWLHEKNILSFQKIERRYPDRQ